MYVSSGVDLADSVSDSRHDSGCGASQHDGDVRMGVRRDARWGGDLSKGRYAVGQYNSIVY